MTKLVIFSWDLSGAATLTPVLPALVQEGFDLHVLSVKPALKWFREEASSWAKVEEYRSGVVEGLGHDASLACFGNPRQSFGLRAWMEISAEKPSLVVLDHWWGLERFFHPTGEPREEALPTRLCTPDAVTAGVLEKAGLPKEMMMVTGQPLLDMCLNDTYLLGQAEPSEIRERLGLEQSRPVCLLASEIIHNHGYYQACTPGCKSVFQSAAGGRELWRAVKEDARKRFDDPVYILRLQPAERFMAEELTPIGWNKASNRDLLTIADGVYGLASMLLIQAAALGGQAICLDNLLDDWAPEQSFIAPDIWSDLKNAGFTGSGDGKRAADTGHDQAIPRVVAEVKKLLDGTGGF